MSNPEKEFIEKPQKALRCSSLKGSNTNNKLDPNNLLKLKKGPRHSVNFCKSNTFQFKAMKAMFEESHDASAKPKKVTEEEHYKFLESRKKKHKERICFKI